MSRWVLVPHEQVPILMVDERWCERLWVLGFALTFFFTNAFPPELRAEVIAFIWGGGAFILHLH